MRVLFLTPPGLKSHLYLQTTVAWALRTAGHDVRVAGQPELVEDLAATGLTGVVVGERQAEVLAEVDETSEPAPQPIPATDDGRLPVQTDYARDDPRGELSYLTTNFLPFLYTDDMLGELVEFARDWRPDLVIWDQMTYAGMIAARACGAAHARILFGADGYVQLWRALPEQGGADDPMREWLEPVLERFGCGPFADDAVTGQWTVDPMPPWIWRPSGVRYVPVRTPAFNGTTVIPDWLLRKPERRRVCLTLGMTHREANVAEASAADLLEAVSDLDVEVVATFTGKQLEGVGTLPDNVRAEDYVPMNALLPTCSAVVHHGGTSTMTAAYEHAVPQLLVPSAYWSEKWYGPIAQGNALAEQGAGLLLSGDSDHLSAAALRAGLVRVLDDPSFRHNAERLRAEWAAVPTPNDLVPALERLTGQYRGARP
ncbi:activator-dependent family glycosyltransferase [Saccharothrix obliqua]|uniref:activator-dependent family glycosyltransferase n=1 Tax=Saccharothrix obliqua TaxID=2861747 RepID=UPI001C5D20E0|nr:activator-dependent family glycosyltransferase [Saccharothrix obliqua]MBW4721835.1 activator-dependent family glycosyltransferase [Saccharothrix obliqua]